MKYIIANYFANVSPRQSLPEGVLNPIELHSYSSSSKCPRICLWDHSSTDFSETDLRPGSLAVRGVRGTRTGVGVPGVVGVVGNTVVEYGPALPFSFEVDAVGVDGSLICELRLLRALTCVPARDMVL